MPYLLLISCAAAFFMFGMTSSIIGPTVEDLALEIGVTVAFVGLLRSGRQLGQFAGYLSFGAAADKFDLRLLALIGSLAMAFGLILVTSEGIILALCAAVVWGFGHSAYNLAPNVVVGRVFVSRSPAIMTTLHGVYGVGAVFGPWLVEAQRHRGVQNIYMISAIMVVVAGLFYLIATRHLAQNAPPLRSRETKQSRPISMRKLSPFLLGVLLFSGALFSASDWLFYHTQNLIHASTQSATLVTSAFWGAMTLGRFLLGAATARFGAQAVIRSSVVSSVLGSIVLAFPTASLSSVLISSMLLGLGLAAIYPILIGTAANLFPDNRGVVTGYLAAAGAFGAIVLPAFQGWLTSNSAIGLVTVLISTTAMAVVLWPMSLSEPNLKRG